MTIIGEVGAGEEPRAAQGLALGRLVAGGALGLLCLAIWVPFAPAMSNWGLDPSWMAGLNQAVAQGLVFGRDVLFTFGPYGSVYSLTYHPATHSLTLVACTVLAVGHFWALVHVFLRDRRTVFAGFVVVLLGLFSRDALLLTYPLLVVYALSERDDTASWRGGALEIVGQVSAIAGLALLLLVKGSILPLAGFAVIAAAVVFIMTGAVARLIMLVAVFCAALAGFWVLAGQPLDGLPTYLAGLGRVIAGYSEAMAVPGRAFDFVLFAAVFVPALAVALFQGGAFWRSGLRLAMLGLAGFVAFKAGFVRHDWHATIALATAVVLLATVVAQLRLPAFVSALWLIGALGAWYEVERANQQIPAHFLMLAKVKQGIVDPVLVLPELARNPDYLKERHERTLAELQRQFRFPEFGGPADVYDFWQSDLLASGSQWSPRPTLQSYSAYTAFLADANARHLEGVRAPQDIAFRITPIDGNHPTLADGASWPMLLAGYEPYDFRESFLYLHRRAGAAAPGMRPVGEGIARLGEDIAVPATRGPVFVQLSVSKTAFGKAKELVFKLENLRIEVKTADGRVRSFRYVSGMGESGFLISPLVENSTEMNALYGHADLLARKRVVSFRLLAPAGGMREWGDTVGYEFQSIDPARIAISPVRPAHAPVVAKADAIAGHTERTQSCFGGLDVLNDLYPAPPSFRIDAILSVTGWLKVPDGTRKAPGAVFLTLTNTASGQEVWIKTRRSPRLDVKTLMGDPFGPDLGYDAYADIAPYSGDYILGIAWANGAEWGRCPAFDRALKFP
ncbi:hypothetical protein [Breoghania sp.]|uniref:hypothetical protein n=1 Tax=Breoghania sp. TaxID=2065378 RepID=UPI002AABB58B|nr:hypothetical protein [Breoghania sp.]